MSEKIIITSDSTTDLGPKLLERYGIKILPLGITLGDKTYYDGIDIDADKIYEYNKKTGELPKTTAANVSEYIEFFEPFVKDGYSVIHFSLSGEMSSTCANAYIAAEELGNVYIVDTRNLSSGGGLLVLAGCDMVKEGLKAKEIAEKCSALAPYVESSFVIDSLEYLHKGGRCSALSVLGANLLKLKPCIEVKNGVMGVGKKYRGKYPDVAKEYVSERLINIEDIDTKRIFLTHAGCDEDLINELYKQIESLGVFEEIFLARASSTISSHCGQNTLGVLFVRKSPIA